MMYHSYLLYIKIRCPYCIKALDLLEREGKSYKTIAIDECPEAFICELKSAYDHNSFPMVLGYDTTCNSYSWIGGCDDLTKHLEHPEKF